MKLNRTGVLNNKEEWLSKGYDLPHFDIDAMAAATKAAPVWVHFGAGNIFRAFHANLAQRMLNEGLTDKGLIVAEGFDYEIVEKQYRAHDNLSVLVTLKANGSVEKTVVGSIAESCILDSANDAEFARMKEIFTSDSLQLCTFTITEKGYSLVNGKGEQLPAVTADFAAGPARPASYIGKVAALLYARYKAGEKPVAMVSTDNCSHNGEKLYGAISAYADEWVKNGLVESGFKAYINDENKVSFPWSMIDKITPRPDASVEDILKKDGLEDLEPVVTSKKTFIAPFVNAEETEYLVIEDKFPNGRPALDKVGVIFTDRETVNKVERMKVTTCLNPLHTALAVYGCLLGYTKISDEMKDEDLVKLVKTLGYKEGLPADLTMIPLVQAGWLRYLMAVNDEGEAFEPSPDPLYEDAHKYVASFKLGDVPSRGEVTEKVLPLLKNAQIFGVDLEAAGLADKVITMFIEELAGKGAVRRTIEKYTA